MLSRRRLCTIIAAAFAVFAIASVFSGRAAAAGANPPETTITDGSAETVAYGTTQFAFASSEPGSSFECSFDGWAQWRPCSSPASYPNLTPGTRTFYVRATDAAGNTDATPPSRIFTISPPDTTPPDTTITDGSAGTVAYGTTQFAFASSEPGSSFECSFDGWAQWRPCSSPASYPNLTPGTRTFSVRATDAAGNTDATPASRSFTVSTAPPSGTGPPSGTVVQADYMTRACPIDGLWGAVSDAYYLTQSCSNWSDAADPQVDYFASGGSPLPGEDGQVHPGYRRLRLTDGRQSIYDATCNSGSPCNSSYRAQAISNSDFRTYYPMKPGHRYVWWLAIRFQDPTPLSGDTASDDSQVWQIKNQGAPCHPDGTNQAGPVEAMTETKNTLRLIERQRDGDLRNDIFPIGPRGVWQTFALDVYYTNDPTEAAYRLWADQDGDSKLELAPLTPKITGRVTAVGPDCIGKPSIGPYQPMSVPAVSRDYGTNEMVEVPLGAEWR